MKGCRLGFLVLAGVLGDGCTARNALPRDDAAAPPPFDAAVGGSDATEEHEAGQDRQGEGPLCQSGAGAEPSQAVLAALSKGEVILFRADGSRTVVERAGSRLWRTGDFLAASSYVGSRMDIVLVDRSGTVRWRHSRQSARDLEPQELWVNSRGAAALILPGTEPPHGVAIAADGTARDLQLSPVGPPNDEGWIPVSVDGGAFDQWGFAHVETGEVRLAPIPLARPSYWPLLTSEGHRIYLGNVGDRLSVVVARPDGVETLPLPAIDVNQALERQTDTGVMVTERGVPRALLRPNPWRLIEIAPLTVEAKQEAWCSIHGNRGLIAVDGIPSWLLDLETAAVSEVAPLVPPWAGRRAPVGVVVNGRWALGDVEWRVDLATGDSLRVDLTGLAPLRPFAPCNAQPPVLLEDGSVAVGLRDDKQGGAYVGQLGQAPWTRIGRPVSGVTTTGARRVGSTWVVSSAYVSSFCPDQPLPAAAGEQTLVGDSVQIVLPGSAEPVVFPGYKGSEFSFDPSGLCGFARGIVYDFATGAKTELPPLDAQPRFGSRLIWW